jgi:hypothetical protein
MIEIKKEEKKSEGGGNKCKGMLFFKEESLRRDILNAYFSLGKSISLGAFKILDSFICRGSVMFPL